MHVHSYIVNIKVTHITSIWVRYEMWFHLFHELLKEVVVKPPVWTLLESEGQDTVQVQTTKLYLTQNRNNRKLPQMAENTGYKLNRHQGQTGE